MRTPIVALLLVASALALPPTDAAGEPMLTDPAGDVQVQQSAQGAPLPGVPTSSAESTGAADLVSLALAETEDTIEITLGVASLSGNTYFADHFVGIQWNDEDYRVEIGVFGGALSGGNANAWAGLQRQQGTDWEWVGTLQDPAVDQAAGTLAVSVPKVYLLDSLKRMPGRGDSILVAGVVSDTNFVNFEVTETRYYDEMPDGDASPVPFALTMGDFSTGKLVLTSPEKLRVSNGGATTFVFQLSVRNLGDAEESYALAVADLPDGWNATIQSPVKVPAKEERTVSILVSVPFAHDHGGFSSFNVSAQAASDPGSNGRVRYGVLHTPIPQPAGHHSELFLHARDPRQGQQSEVFANVFPFSTSWMNTQEDHAEDAAFTVPFSNGDDEFQFWIPLNPALQMGLDFDITQLGSLVGTIEANRDAAADITADLYYWAGDDDSGESILLAEGEPSPIALTQSGAVDFEVTLTPQPDADYVAYQPNAGMYLVITMTGANLVDQFGNTPLRPRLHTDGFVLKLPLNEYHDRLTGQTEAAQTIEIVAKDLVEKVGRGGTTLTYAFDVRNQGPPTNYVFDLAGNDVEHATLVPAGEVALATGESREVVLAVQLPYNANPGQEFEVLLFVHAKDDPSKMAIARTKTRAAAEGEEAMEDESAALLAAQARENDTPAPGLALVLAGAAVVAMALRRRE